MNAARVSVIWPSSMGKGEVLNVGMRTAEDMKDIGRAFACAIEECCLGLPHSEGIERHQIILVVEAEASTELRCGTFGAPEA